MATRKNKPRSKKAKHGKLLPKDISQIKTTLLQAIEIGRSQLCIIDQVLHRKVGQEMHVDRIGITNKHQIPDSTLDGFDPQLNALYAEAAKKWASIVTDSAKTVRALIDETYDEKDEELPSLNDLVKGLREAQTAVKNKRSQIDVLSAVADDLVTKKKLEN